MISAISKKIASGIGALKRTRPFITTNTAIQLYHALIEPHFDYCCSIWDGLGENHSMEVQKFRTELSGS